MQKSQTFMLIALAGLILSPVLLADSGRAMPANVPKAYQQECAACHLAYPPGLLPAESWHRLMGRLDKHFGTDASIDPASVKLIASWLQDNGGQDKYARQVPPHDRITSSNWFQRKHANIQDAVWRLPSVKSAANCQACHVGAERGRFSDDNLKLPAGLSPLQRNAFQGD
ncbi:diheme cytochrome c [Chromobacterium alticapitis]|uniref:Cytochrome C n=1 Tax=Chromobacterium alticapitis TaxID=2073169 RepID=A0A2S5DEF5_9NEIS|nr:diheme cytochrome c [Chromobacterium alticapitis]POZ61419.1 cytochrome C [Chromobacterium alticapitis]